MCVRRGKGCHHKAPDSPPPPVPVLCSVVEPFSETKMTLFFAVLSLTSKIPYPNEVHEIYTNVTENLHNTQTPPLFAFRLLLHTFFFPTEISFFVFPLPLNCLDRSI